jgi:hypothetical protein
VTAKKELIKIKGNQGTLLGHRANVVVNGMHFAFSTAPKSGVRTQVSMYTNCREILCDRFGNSFRMEDEIRVDTEKMRLLVIETPPQYVKLEDYKKRLFSGKAALNLLEGINKWPESKIATVNHEVYKDAWLITGPKEWISCPQMLSMATWVLRLCANFGPAETESLESFKEWLDALAEQQPKDVYGYTCADISTDLLTVKDKLFTLIENYDEVFGPFSMESVWRIEDSYANFGIESGFRTFLTSRPHTREARAAQKIFNDILIKEGFEAIGKCEKEEKKEVESPDAPEEVVAEQSYTLTFSASGGTVIPTGRVIAGSQQYVYIP